MLNRFRGQLIAILFVFLIGVTLAFLPHHSGEKNEVKEVVESPSLDAKVQQAVELITSQSGAPMKGIALLKEVLDEDPKNIKALYYLGVFSIQSGQYEKAIDRFNAILEIEPLNSEVRLLLAQSYLQVAQSEKARKELELVLNSDAEDQLKDKARNIIQEIK